MTCEHPNRGLLVERPRMVCPDCGAELGMVALMPSPDSGLGFDRDQPVVITSGRPIAHLMGNAKWRGPLDDAALRAQGLFGIETHGFLLETVAAEQPRTLAEVVEALKRPVQR
jgi:hypothetical protein